MSHGLMSATRKPPTRGAEIWMSRSTDEGRTFSPDSRVLGDVCECCRTQLQIDASGRMFLSYRTVPSSGPMFRDIVRGSLARWREELARRLFVNQDEWEVNACPVAGPALSIDAGGQVSVTWFTGGGGRPGLYHASSADHGASFHRAACSLQTRSWGNILKQPWSLKAECWWPGTTWRIQRSRAGGCWI